MMLLKLSELNPIYVRDICYKYLTPAQVDTVIKANTIKADIFDNIEVSKEDLKDSQMIAHMFLSCAQRLFSNNITS